MPLSKTVAMVHAIVMGVPFTMAKTILGLKINKNTWTKYIKDVGMILGEDIRGGKGGMKIIDMR